MLRTTLPWPWRVYLHSKMWTTDDNGRPCCTIKRVSGELNSIMNGLKIVINQTITLILN